MKNSTGKTHINAEIIEIEEIDPFIQRLLQKLKIPRFLQQILISTLDFFVISLDEVPEYVISFLCEDGVTRKQSSKSKETTFEEGRIYEDVKKGKLRVGLKGAIIVHRAKVTGFLTGFDANTGQAISRKVE